jgi:hypothetical protein
MKSVKRGAITSVSVENITPLGIWLFVKGREYFLRFDDYPFMKGQTINAIHDVVLLHEHHLYWPALDADLEIDNLENPGKYPLKSTTDKRSGSHTGRLRNSRVKAQKRTLSK